MEEVHRAARGDALARCAGKALAAQRVGVWKMGAAGAVTHSERRTVMGSPAAVVFVRRTDMKVVSVPFRFEVAVGVKQGG